MKKRKLRDIEVSEIGMGCMAFSHGYGQSAGRRIPSRVEQRGILCYLRQRGDVILPPIFFQKLADPPLTTP